MENQIIHPSEAFSTADDFKRIRGIGPGIESRLHRAGILTYAQLAAQPIERLAELCKGIAVFSLDRITEQDWTGQARALMSTAQPAEPVDEPRQHYENFTVELLLDAHNVVRRTQITHVQSQAVTAWAGWGAARLLDFLRETAAIQAAAGDISASGTPAMATPAVSTGYSSSPIPPEKTQAPVLVQIPILALEPLELATGRPTWLLGAGQPFNLRLVLDLSQLAAPAQIALGYTATFYAHRVRAGEDALLGSLQGRVTTGGQAALQYAEAVLPKGVYRLGAYVILAAPAASLTAGQEFSAFLEGGVIQVY